MLRTVRASIRLPVFFILTFFTVVFVAIGNILLGLFSHRWAVRWKNIVIRCWAGGTAFIIGMKIHLKGNPPEPPFFLVSNHLSYVDVIPLWLFTEATFVAKSEIKSWPFFGWGTRTLGVLFINRELKRDVHRMNRRISETISGEQGLILFPEGTSTKGEKVLSFKPPLLQYPAEKQLPVHYVSISYDSFDEHHPAHKSICWWGDMAFFPHFWNILKMPGFNATVHFGGSCEAVSDRKILATELQEAVSKNFIPVVEKQHTEKMEA